MILIEFEWPIHTVARDAFYRPHYKNVNEDRPILSAT